MYVIRLNLKKEEGNNDFQNRPYGYILRAVFLKWVQTIDPKIFHEFHEKNQIRKYSIKTKVAFEEIFMQIILFNNDIGLRLATFLIEGKKDILLGDQIYIINSFAHGIINLQEIYEKCDSIKKFNLEFITPTYFNTSQGDYPVRVPIPEMIFSYLMNLYNIMCFENGMLLQEDFIEWVKTHIYIPFLKIETRSSNIGKKSKVAGFVGNVAFVIKKPNSIFYKNKNSISFHHSAYCKIVEFLCKLGEYTGIGTNRTTGLGTYKYLRK